MIINTISYWIAEAISSIIKNQKIFWSGVAIMTITLFLISFFCVLFHCSNLLLDMFEDSQGKIEVFPDYKTGILEVKLDDIDSTAMQRVKAEILTIEAVKTARLVQDSNGNEGSGEQTTSYYEVTLEDYRLANQTIEKLKLISGIAQGENDIILKEMEYDLESKLWGISGVKDVEHISKEEAIERAKDRVPSGMTEGVPDDIYPESYIVTIEDLGMANAIAQEIRGLDGVGEEADDVLVNENSNLISKLAISAKVLAVTIFIITSVGSCYVMMNSIKLMLYARRREISIMKYVGATDTFTKAPFVIEGLIIGLVSAIIVIVITAWFCNGFAELANQVAFLSFLTTLSEIVPTISLILIALGVGTGSIGSSMSINKYLEV